MKNKRVELLRWLSDNRSDIDIDWPKVHKSIGLDHTSWLLNQSEEVCQVMLEHNNTYCCLIAEFYDEQALQTYHLMWAK